MKKRQRWAFLIAWIGAGLLLFLILTVAGATLRSVLLCTIVFALLIPMGIHAVKGRLDLFEPLIVANLALGIMFVGRPLTDMVTGNTIHLGYDIMPTFDDALLVALVGICSFQLGYFSPFGKVWARSLPVPPPLRRQRAAFLGWVYIIVGGMLFGAFLSRQGGVGLLLVLLKGRQQSNNFLFLNSTGYLYNGILMWGAAALVFFALAVVFKRPIYWLWFLLPTFCLLIFYGARGTRSMLLPLVIAVPVFWYLWQRRRPHARTVIAAALVGVALLGWLRDVRTAGEARDPLSTLGAAVTSPASEAARILGGADADMFDSLANALQVIPRRLPFQHGATFTDILVRAVPRPLWPNKPLESNDAMVKALWPAHYAVSRGSSAFSILGVFYADSGYATVILGTFGIGVALSVVWHWLRHQRDQPVVQLIYAMGLPFVIILMRGTIPGTLTRMLFLFVPLLLLMWLSRLRWGVVPRAAQRSAAYDESHNQ